MHTKTTLALTLGALAGCAAGVGPAEPAPPARTPADGAAPAADPAEDRPAAVAHVDDNLARLRALAVVEVGALVVDAPEGAYACYGPCPQYAAEIAAAERRSAERLERLVDVAAAAAPDPSAASCEPAAIDRNLAALRDLRIVTVEGLFEDTSDTADVEAARARTCERAGKLAGIVAAAKAL